MKQWIDQTQILLDWVTEAEEALHTTMRLISTEESPIERLWHIAVAESMHDGMTLERVRESLTSLREALTRLVEAMKRQK
jgi:hypothetical protein